MLIFIICAKCIVLPISKIRPLSTAVSPPGNSLLIGQLQSRYNNYRYFSSCLVVLKIKKCLVLIWDWIIDVCCHNKVWGWLKFGQSMGAGCPTSAKFVHQSILLFSFQKRYIYCIESSKCLKRWYLCWKLSFISHLFLIYFIL